jgi:hypothetical protein
MATELNMEANATMCPHKRVNADIVKVQEWLGHTNIATTKLYDRRGYNPEKSASFFANY